MKNAKVINTTQIAMMLALLISVQIITRALGQLVTGSIVNLILLVSVFMIGIYGGLIVAILSPILAFLAGVGSSFVQITAFIAIGNAFFVTVAWLIARNSIVNQGVKEIMISSIGLITASICKFLFLWQGIVMFALPLIPDIKEKQIAMLSAAFSWPQLITALIGSLIAMVILPQIKKTIYKDQSLGNLAPNRNIL